MINGPVGFLLAMHGWPVLVAVFLLPMLESSAFVGFVFPGEIAVVLGGVLASQHRVSLVAVLVSAACGAVAGDTIGYAVGRRWGPQLVHGVAGRFVRQAHLARGERYLAERGGRAVFFGRFTAVLRVVMPGLAGTVRMPYRTFALYNIAGGVLWAVVIGLLGYFAGASWEYASHVASRIGLLLVVLLAAVFGASLLVHAVRERAPWLRRAGEWWTSSRGVRWVRRRFPALWGWLVRRVELRVPSGLALTCAVLVAAASAWSFAGLTQDVLAREESVELDVGVQAWVVTHRADWLTTSMQGFTWLGSGLVLVPVLLAAGVYSLVARREVRDTVALWAAFLGSVGLYELVKALVARPRPPAMDDLVRTVGASFPSGHMTQALATWGMLAFLLLRARPHRAWSLVTSAILLVLLVGASRIYLGAHWLTDVLGGLALGATWLTTLLIVYLITRAPLVAERVPAPESHDGPAPATGEVLLGGDDTEAGSSVGGHDCRHDADQSGTGEADSDRVPRDRQRGDAAGHQSDASGQSETEQRAVHGDCSGVQADHAPDMWPRGPERAQTGLPGAFHCGRDEGVDDAEHRDDDCQS